MVKRLNSTEGPTIRNMHPPLADFHEPDSICPYPLGSPCLRAKTQTSPISLSLKIRRSSVNFLVFAGTILREICWSPHKQKLGVKNCGFKHLKLKKNVDNFGREFWA